MDDLYHAKWVDHELPPGWPGELRLQEVKARANDSFIWAATFIRYLYDADDVDERIDRLLQENTVTLGDLYATALRSACSWDPSDSFTQTCLKILGGVVVGRIQLTDDMVTELLGLDNARSCRLVLRRMGCLLQWSEGQPIRTLHASFADYLTNPNSCGDQPWFINEAKYHLGIAIGCLRIMKKLLRFNMCRLETSYLKNRDVTDLVDRIGKFIPRSLSYACRFWAEHLNIGKSEDPYLLSFVLEFFQNLFLYWLEVLSLIGDGRAALQGLMHAVEYSKACDLNYT